MAAEIEANFDTFMTTAAIAELGSGPAPVVDRHPRPRERFVVEVVVRRGPAERRAAASGEDIYATTAPLVVEAAARLLDPSVRKPGVHSAGEIFDARDFLGALSPEHLSVRYG